MLSLAIAIDQELLQSRRSWKRRRLWHQRESSNRSSLGSAGFHQEDVLLPACQSLITAYHETSPLSIIIAEVKWCCLHSASSACMSAHSIADCFSSRKKTNNGVLGPRWTPLLSPRVLEAFHLAWLLRYNRPSGTHFCVYFSLSLLLMFRRCKHGNAVKMANDDQYTVWSVRMCIKIPNTM